MFLPSPGSSNPMIVSWINKVSDCWGKSGTLVTGSWFKLLFLLILLHRNYSRCFIEKLWRASPPTLFWSAAESWVDGTSLWYFLQVRSPEEQLKWGTVLSWFIITVTQNLDTHLSNARSNKQQAGSLKEMLEARALSIAEVGTSHICLSTCIWQSSDWTHNVPAL